MRQEKFLKRHPAETIFLVVFFFFFVVQALTLLYPLFWVITNSLKTPFEYYESSFNMPSSFLIQNYGKAFVDIAIKDSNFLILFWNSVWIAVISSVVNISSSMLAAYAMAKYRFPGKSVIYSIAILVQVLPIIGSGPAAYQFIYKTGIADNPALIWLTWAGGFDFAFIVLMGYFKSISSSYAEAAFIDGATNFRVMYQIMIPQAVPAIASLMILNLIGGWNNYSTSMLYMKSYPNLALAIYLFDKESQFAETGTPVYLAVIVLSILPILAVFITCQKMIMTNVTAGGLKG